ncbi:MAG: NAD(P)/FAD-dependent oxidoreductase [Planctomycetia bacterium]|jgi:glycine oxidase
MATPTDCCIIGGGVIGLSIARELAGRGLRVRVLSRDRGRDTASWAAAGIFPPAPTWPGAPPGDLLTAWSDRLHREWAEALREETGIDNELRPAGGLHLAADAPGLERLREAAADWQRRGAACEWVERDAIARIEPSLAAAIERGGIVGGYLLPEEMSIRPPRHLAALEASCRRRGVEITAGAAVTGIEVRGGRVEGVATTGGIVRAETYCLAAGAWSEALARPLGLRFATRPIRGQIVLLALPQQVLGRVVNVGLNYLVPRDDGRLLVGSTLEDAGFAKETTAEAIDWLLGFAHGLLGDLPSARMEQAWAGLRPGSADGLPSIGQVPGIANAFVAAGHFRAGLHQSTGTAVLLADLMAGAAPAIDPTPFNPARPSATAAAGVMLPAG